MRRKQLLSVAGAIVVLVVACCSEAMADLPTSLPSEGASLIAAPAEGYSFAGSFVRMVGGFLLCLGVFAGGVHLYRRYGAVALRGNSRRLTIVERIPITAKSALTLVALDGREFLVTSGPDNLRVVSTPAVSKETFDESLAMASHDTEVCDA